MAVEVDVYVSLGVALVPAKLVEQGACAVEARHGRRPVIACAARRDDDLVEFLGNVPEFAVERYA